MHYIYIKEWVAGIVLYLTYLPVTLWGEGRSKLSDKQAWVLCLLAPRTARYEMKRLTLLACALSLLLAASVLAQDSVLSRARDYEWAEDPRSMAFTTGGLEEFTPTRRQIAGVAYQGLACDGTSRLWPQTNWVDDYLQLYQADPFGSLEPWEVRTQEHWRGQCKHDRHEGISANVDCVHSPGELFNTYDYDSICDLMGIDPPENGMCGKARRQFMALLLNVASGKLGVCNPFISMLRPFATSFQVLDPRD